MKDKRLWVQWKFDMLKLRERVITLSYWVLEQSFKVTQFTEN